MILVDIDHFKLVNDTNVHRAGDEVLSRAAQKIRTGLRTCDVAVRYGGDEFLIIAANTDCENGSVIAEWILDRVRENAVAIANGSLVPITVSIGVAALLSNECAGSVISRVDCALYMAKQQGRDRISVAAAVEAPRGNTESSEPVVANRV